MSVLATLLLGFWNVRKVKVAQSCQLFVTLWTVACQVSGSIGILQARILGWVTISFSRGSSWPRNWTQVSHTASRFFTIWAIKEAHEYQRVVLKASLAEASLFCGQTWKILQSWVLGSLLRIGFVCIGSYACLWECLLSVYSVRKGLS